MGVSRLLGRPNPALVAVASAPMRTALERRAKRLDVSIRPQALLTPLSLVAVVSAALVAAAVLFSDGSSDDPLIWIGGLAIVFAAAAGVSATVGVVAVPELTVLGLATFGCFAAFVGWQGLSVLWSIEADRTWNYVNRALVYLAFLVLGLALGTIRRAPRYAAGWLAVVTAAAIVCALGTKIFPRLSAETERVARLSSPIGYWNVLALLTVFALPLALWIAAPRSRPDWLRAVAVVYLYAALMALLLTFSRGGVAVGIVAVALWLAIGRPRVESAAALGVAIVPTLAIAGWAFSRPGLTKDAQPRSLQVHDGRWFGLALVLGGIGAFAAAFCLSRYERGRPLSAAWRLRVGRAGVAAAVASVVIGIGGLIAAGITPAKIWHKFNEPAASPTAISGPGHLGSIASTSRWNWWQEAWKAWRAHPAVGTGAGTFELTHRKLRVDGTVATEPHNLPLQFLSETGIVGFILFLGIALAGAGALVETLRRLEGEDRLAAAALVVVLFAYVTHGVVDFDWDFVAVTGPGLAVLGVLLAAGRPARVRMRARRGVLAVAAGAFAAAALYSLASPWLASRRVDDAYAALGRGDAAAAVSDARSAHDLNPVSVDALLTWGTAEVARGNTAAAGRLYTKAISIQPDNWRPWYYRARLLEKVSGPTAARFDAQQAAARDPLGLAGAYAASLATGQ
jgi:O-antigen ligase/polysaccharide polymerase Wzy-like membrane protein